jgi:hypothetical protein
MSIIHIKVTTAITIKSNTFILTYSIIGTTTVEIIIMRTMDMKTKKNK